MRSVVFVAIALFGLIVSALSGATPRPTAALGATPAGVVASPAAGPPELCSDAQLALGESVFRAPEGPEAGSVIPEGSNGERLFLVAMTLPPGACIGWRQRDGGVILLAQEGTIDYTARYTDDASALEVLTGDSDDPDCAPTDPGCGTIAVQSDTTVTLHANDWVTQDRGMWYTFRNGGAEDAVVSVASYVIPWAAPDPCHGGCRAP